MNCANGQACANTWPFQLRVPFYLRHSKDVYELLTVDSGTCIRVSGPLGRENMSFTAWAFSFRDCLHCFQANIYYALSNTRWSFFFLPPPTPRPSAFAVSLHHSASHSGAVVWGSVTSRKVAGSIPDGVLGVFHWLNLSCRTMVLGSSQSLT